MNRARHQLLASSSLACDQYGRVGRADTIDSLENLREAWGMPDDAVRYLPPARDSTGLVPERRWFVDRSLHGILQLSNRSAQCVEQRAVVERLPQKSDRACAERTLLYHRLIVCRDEHDWDRRSRCDEPLLQVEAVHARKLHVENGARSAIQVAAVQEVFGRAKRFDREASRPDEPLDRSSKQFIVVDNRDQRTIGWFHGRQDSPRRRVSLSDVGVRRNLGL